MLTEDWMMRQVDALARSIAYLVFQKDSTDYVPGGTAEDAALDELHRRLLEKVNAGDIGGAEDLLFAESDPDDRRYLELAVDFYARLNGGLRPGRAGGGPAGYGGPVRRIAAVVRGGVGMKVEFGAMEETAIPGFKGGEGVTHARMFADGCNRIMRGRLEPGCSIGLHTHEGSSEIVYVLSGTGKALYGGGEERLAPGDCHYCPEGHAHSLVNDGTQTLEFFAVVPQHG